MITAYHARYFAHELTCRHATDGVDRLSQSLFDARVDLNPHQIEAALFALRNPMQQGVLLADEVGLGKTIEAALVLCQYWAERRRRLLVICPASLRQQWAQELREKFAVPSLIVDARVLRQQRSGDQLCTLKNIIRDQVVIVSYQLAAKLETEFRAIEWDIFVMDETHKLRNAHRPNNRIGQALRRALAGRKKLLLTATPLQNSQIELYGGLSTLLDEHLFGSEQAFRSQYMPNMDTRQLAELRGRIAPFTKTPRPQSKVSICTRSADFRPLSGHTCLRNLPAMFIHRPIKAILQVAQDRLPTSKMQPLLVNQHVVDRDRSHEIIATIVNSGILER